MKQKIFGKQTYYRKYSYIAAFPHHVHLRSVESGDNKDDVGRHVARLRKQIQHLPPLPPPSPTVVVLRPLAAQGLADPGLDAALGPELRILSELPQEKLDLWLEGHQVPNGRPHPVDPGGRSQRHHQRHLLPDKVRPVVRRRHQRRRSHGVHHHRQGGGVGGGDGENEVDHGGDVVAAHLVEGEAPESVPAGRMHWG